MKHPKKPQDLLVAVLPTTIGGTTIEAKITWSPQDTAYYMDLRAVQWENRCHAYPPFKLDVAKAFSFKKLQTLAAGCLLRDDVRQAIHRLCSEQGLTLLNPVF